MSKTQFVDGNKFHNISGTVVNAALMNKIISPKFSSRDEDGHVDGGWEDPRAYGDGQRTGTNIVLACQAALEKGGKVRLAGGAYIEDVPGHDYLGVLIDPMPGCVLSISPGCAPVNLKLSNGITWQAISCAKTDVPSCKNSMLHPEVFGAIPNGSRSGTGTNNKDAIDKTISALPNGGELSFLNGTYFTNHFDIIRKSIKITGMHGTEIVFDLPQSGGNSAIHFEGALSTNSHYINDTVIGDNFIVCTTPSNASNYSKGDVLLIQDNTPITKVDGSGVLNNAINQLVVVVDSNSTTGKILIDRRIDYAFNSTQNARITKVLCIEKPEIKNFNIYETTKTEYAGQVNADDCPHIIKLKYCRFPAVENVNLENWQLDAVTFSNSMDGYAKRIFGKNPTLTSSGRGYLIATGFCSNITAENITGENVRHCVDMTGGQDTRSVNNIARFNIVTNPGDKRGFTTHGHHEKRFVSINDKVIGSCNGWAIGNTSFDAAYDCAIINPVYIGSGDAITVSGNSDNVKIINPSIKTYFRGIELNTGAKNIFMFDGQLDISGATVPTSTSYRLLFADQHDQYPCGNITIKGTKFIGSPDIANVIKYDGNGELVIEDCDIGESKAENIYIGQYSDYLLSNFIFRNNRFTGTGKTNLRIWYGSDCVYDISNNRFSTCSEFSLKIPIYKGLRLVGNHFETADATAFSFLTSGTYTDLINAITAGAIISDNNIDNLLFAGKNVYGLLSVKNNRIEMSAETTVLVNGANQLGSSLNVDGFVSATTALQGAYFKIAGVNTLFQIIKTSNIVNGAANILITPYMSVSPADNAQVSFLNLVRHQRFLTDRPWSVFEENSDSSSVLVISPENAGKTIKIKSIPDGTDGLELFCGASPYIKLRALLSVYDNLRLETLGKGLCIKEGTNGRAGVATLVAGFVTVSNNTITATTRIKLTIQSLGTVTSPKAICVSARVVGTSFTILSADNTDTSVVYWELSEPA